MFDFIDPRTVNLVLGFSVLLLLIGYAGDALFSRGDEYLSKGLQSLSRWDKLVLWLNGPNQGVSDGAWVAEVWFHRGRTWAVLYRARFADSGEAAFANKGALWLLNRTLPETTKPRGKLRPMVHKATPSELARRGALRTIWSPVLPGNKNFSGERASGNA